MQARTAIITVALTVACGGNPLKIENCKDQLGRGATAPNNVKLTCEPTGGPEVWCRATADNSADLYVYCPLSFDVTNQTQWISSDPSLGVFDPSHPGHLRAVGSHGHRHGELYPCRLRVSRVVISTPRVSDERRRAG